MGREREDVCAGANARCVELAGGKAFIPRYRSRGPGR